MRKLITIFVLSIFVLWGCTVLVATGSANMHLDDSPNVQQEQSSQIGSQLEKIGDKVNEIDNTVEKTNDRIKDVKATVKSVDSTLVKTIKEQ
jgi:peptidoglycan hydrolase CwlO-like protein